MKKLLTLAFLLIAYLGIGQVKPPLFPNEPKLGAPTDIVHSLGAIRGDTGFIISKVIFVDTISANRSSISRYPSAFIMTSTNNYPRIWVRTLDTLRWDLIADSALVALKVNISDTANMLANYLRKTDTSTMLAHYIRNGYAVKYTDTISMLSGYARSGLVLKYTDTAAMLSNRLKTSDTASAFAKYLRKTDTANMLSPYIRNAGSVTSVATNNGTGITGGTITTTGTLVIDTSGTIATIKNARRIADSTSIHNQLGSNLVVQPAKFWVNDTAKITGVLSINNVIAESPHSQILFNTNTSASFPRYTIIDSNGNAGIGIASTEILYNKLEVIGDITSKGLQWTLRTTPEDVNFNSVCYGNGIFVAVGYSGTNRIMTSPDGINWTGRLAPASNQWNAVCYGNGLFVATAITGTGNRIMTSPDGINWSLHNASSDNQWYGVTYGNGLFVSCGIDSLHSIQTSPDGITWTNQTVPTSSNANHFKSVFYGNGLFVAVANTGAINTRILTSPDGITWTQQTYPVNNKWSFGCYGNGLFVVGSNLPGIDSVGHQVMTSPDAVTWTLRSTPADNAWNGVAYGNGLFVEVASSGSGNRIMTSTDAINWILRIDPIDNDWNAVAYGNGVFSSVSSTGAGNRVMTSGKTDYMSLSPNNIYQGGIISKDTIISKSFKITSGTSAQALAADGGLLTGGTGINITGGQIVNTSTSSGGTVTSIATNTGTGLLGGTITTTGTLLNDTLNIDTKLWRQKGVDSLNGLISARVKYTDTSSILSNLLRKTDTSTMLLPFFRLSGRSGGQTGYGGTNTGDSLRLSANSVDAPSILLKGGATSGVNINYNLPNNTTAFTANILNVQTSITNTATNSKGLVGITSSPSISGSNTGNITSSTGVVGITSTPTVTLGATGVFTNMASIRIAYANSALGDTITNMYGLWFSSATNSGKIISQAGSAIVALTQANNNVYHLWGTTTIPSGNWGLFGSTSYDNYLGTGRTLINTTTPPANTNQKLTVVGKTHSDTLDCSVLSVTGTVSGNLAVNGTITSQGNITATGGNFVVSQSGGALIDAGGTSYIAVYGSTGSLPNTLSFVSNSTEIARINSSGLRVLNMGTGVVSDSTVKVENGVLKMVASGGIAFQHTIFTPTTGSTVNLVNNQYNIINPAGALLALTVNLPSSPNNNDVVIIKFTQSVTTVTYTGGTVVDAITGPVAATAVILAFDSGTGNWY